MNFLAHLLLSNNDDDIMVGNFIADSVRSAEYGQFKPEVVEGIKLHHKIDFFTDNHSIVLESKERLRPTQSKYSPVVVDILYDHFLAKNFHQYSDVPLEKFAANAYALFNRRWDELPKGVQRILPYMENGNWLVNYGNRHGLERVFMGMSRRASFQNDMKAAVAQMFDDYDLFADEFARFFPELKNYVDEEIARIPWGIG